MLSVIMLSVIMLSVIILNVVMLIVVASANFSCIFEQAITTVEAPTGPGVVFKKLRTIIFQSL
jgi:hypothetical protein